MIWRIEQQRAATSLVRFFISWDDDTQQPAQKHPATREFVSIKPHVREWKRVNEAKKAKKSSYWNGVASTHYIMYFLRW